MAGIEIEITGAYNQETSDIKIGGKYSGTRTDIIKDPEREFFGLSSDNLKTGIENFVGARPDDVYLRRPTPWGDHETTGLKQVSRTLVSKGGGTRSIKCQHVNLVRQVLENKSAEEAHVNVAVSATVENTVSHSWSPSGELTASQEINYCFDIEKMKMGDSPTFSYSSGWGQNTKKSHSITVGSTSAMNRLMHPGETVVADLYSNKVSVQLEVEYEASLAGLVALNYRNRYMGRCRWNLDINDVMSHSGLSRSLVSKEVIDIVFYAKTMIIIRDEVSIRDCVYFD